ncbi:MAG: pectin esterase [Ignavibacteria bacterium CG22_combo_CG10-13_8_21_14_all_37_15]|nr:pectin esterase [Ignavibacteria bacterium]PIP77870.1 MAG: pectin esterase [Ignavibacteria bacterium CG22_combo_CG10-13_8_21_14_all_37_15]PIS44205.1 MAG: pectin esterase [Ignavibacteria bacterium CG08_land_8_20_14_0_20_37_9]PIX94116.1 MAG: pectin esterase [Ignavibacteria bacterium CG_4_10_14_3_um_filter_37_18]
MISKSKIFFTIVLAAMIFFVEMKGYTPDIIVAKDGSGNFISIQQAIDALPAKTEGRYVILIKNGIYHEKIFIEKSSIAFIGEDRESTMIVYAELRSNWKAMHQDDWGAAVVNIKEGTSDLIFQNLTVHNNYGSLYGRNDHQFAIRGGGTRIILVDCNIIADGGDALSLWNKVDGMYYHKNCYFEGYVDYVCPRGWCYITDSKFYGHNKNASLWHDGSNDENQKFVICNSKFDGVPGFALGRFHRDAQFYLVDCTFSNNMADKAIYHKISDPPVRLRWGEKRIYFFNCHGDSIDYSWHEDNLDFAQSKFSPDGITPAWIFKGKWDPVAILKEMDENK